jgi:hypothetical protein
MFWVGFGPSNCLLRASSAFQLFETGLRSLELSSLGQQCLQVIRDWASVPRIVFFGPAVSSKLFEPGLWSLELSHSGQQCLQIIRAWASVPRIISFESAALLLYSSSGPCPSNHLFRVSSASALFKFGPLSLESLFWAINTLNTWILVATYQFACRMSNTKVSPRFATPDGPVFVSSALYREIFHTYGMKFAPMNASGASQWTGLRSDKSNAAQVGVAPAHVDSSRGTRIWVS